MSEPKVQLVDPVGNMSVTGMSAVGVVTASSFDGVSNSSVSGLTGTPELNLGIVTATSFVGQGDGHAAGLAGTPELNLGVTTATSFVGDATGKAAGLRGTPNLNVGLITATSFVGFVTGNVTGNISGLAASVTPGVNLGVGVCTALEYYGDGSTLTGAGSSAYIAQEVNATSGSTTINLNNGNVIYYTSSSNTAISFSNPSAAEQITFIRDAGNSYTITWPATVKWNNNTTPTLFEKNGGYQIFHFTTVDTGSSYQAWEQSASPSGYGMFVYGYNSGGSLGLNNNVSYSSPTQVGGTYDFTGLWQCGYAGNQSVFQKNTSELFVAGYNSNGSLGQNDRTNRSSPIQIPGTWTQATVGENVIMATKGGSAYIWGQNSYGQLGHNDVNRRSSPTQLPGTWSANAGKTCIGNQSSFAIDTSGQLYSWGRNFTGILGHDESGGGGGYPGSRSSPTQVGGNTNWNQMLHCDTIATSATKTDGTLWSWGYGGSGQHGKNNITAYSSPAQVGTDTNWSRAFMLNNCQIGSKTNGTLWGWGSGSYGSTGQNNRTALSSPTQIGTDTNWVHGSLEGSWNGGGFCKKTDGTLWCWGWNGDGQLGLNNRTAYSSPVQVPSYSTGWLAYGRIGGARNAIIK